MAQLWPGILIVKLKPVGDMYPGYTFKEGGPKWEPCAKRSRTFSASSLSRPVFDIYHHLREDGRATNRDRAIPFTLVVSVRAPRVHDLYDRVVRAYAGVLVPI